VALPERSTIRKTVGIWGSKCTSACWQVAGPSLLVLASKSKPPTTPPAVDPPLLPELVAPDESLEAVADPLLPSVVLPLPPELPREPRPLPLSLVLLQAANHPRPQVKAREK
jgi:hypothetical protein